MIGLKLSLVLASIGIGIVLAGPARSQVGMPYSEPTDPGRQAASASRPTSSASRGGIGSAYEDLEERGVQIAGARGRDWNFPRDVDSICSKMHALGGRGYHLSQALAEAILKRTDDLPIEIHWRLVWFAGQHVDVEGKSIKREEAFGEVRKRHTVLVLEAWQRTEKRIDKKWDPNEEIPPPPRPPGGAGYMPGITVPPEAIADPKIRAEYEAALKAYGEKVKRFSEQYRAHLLETSYKRQAILSLFEAYTKAPERIEELKGLLDKYLADLVEAKELDEIVQAVKDKRLPAHLGPFSITTRPGSMPASAPARTPG